MKVSNVARVATLAGALAIVGGASFAANIDPDGPYFNLGTCSVFDVTPNADDCYGSVGIGSTNAQQVDVNGAEFFEGDTNASNSTIGLFGYDDWEDLASDPSVQNGGKTGSFDIGDYSMFSQVAVMLKAGNSWAAYLFEGGLGPVEFEFDISESLDAGLSNWRIIGRDGDIPEVPLPAAGWLLIGGIGGLVALRRKKSA